jgi:hypothetical protein
MPLVWKGNYEVVARFVEGSGGSFSFLAEDPATRSPTSVCLRMALDEKKVTYRRHCPLD